MSRINYWKVLTRRKHNIGETTEDSKLGRVLDTYDLTGLGVSAALGVGIYVLAGHVAKDQAGPSVVLSFMIAAGASLLAGLCYAEFGARVPKSGSAYVYSYTCIGELVAFVVGWNLLLEYIIGSASVSRGLSLYLDSMLNNTMKNAFTDVAPMSWEFLATYFDFFAFCVPILLGTALAFGLKKSANINNIFSISNIAVVLYVIIAGSIKTISSGDIAKNWKIDPSTVPTEYNVGAGYFFPFGFEGTLKGAGTCFFAFAGFDIIATTGEEVRHPHKALPRAIIFSLLIIFAAYFGVSTILTLMWPYYLQDVNAPLPYVFNEIGWTASKWIVSIGGIIGLIASLFGAMFPLPRILYAMAQDRLIFEFLGKVSDRFKTPVMGTLCAACLTGLFAALFDLPALVNMLSIGVLLAYTVVAISIIVLRFSDNQMEKSIMGQIPMESSNLLRPGQNVTTKSFLSQLVVCTGVKLPTTVSMAVVSFLLSVYCLSALGLALMISYASVNVIAGETWSIVLSSVFLGTLLTCACLISVQPKEMVRPSFKVPFVPFIPAISIFINIYLMLMLDVYTWIRFGVWMILGLIIYCLCACKSINTKEIQSDDLPQVQHHSNGLPTINDTNNNHKENGFVNGKIDEIIIESDLQPRKSDLEIIFKSNGSLYTNYVAKPVILDKNLDQESSDEKETTMALEMLDTVLKAEDEEEDIRQKLAENVTNITRQNSTQSIQSIAKKLSIVAVVHHEDLDRHLPVAESSKKSELTLKIVDPETIRKEVGEQIDFVLAQAIKDVEEQKELESLEKLKNLGDPKFLTHLSQLMAAKTQTFPKPKADKVPTSPQLPANPFVRNLKHSKSTPNFAFVRQQSDENGLMINLEDKDDKSIIPKPPPFIEELMRQIIMKPQLREQNNEVEKKLAEPIIPDNPKLSENLNSQEVLLVSEEVEEENKRATIKEKLEIILSQPPMRYSFIKPKVIPRTIEENAESAPIVKPIELEKTDSTEGLNTVKKQKILFNDVLKSFKPPDDGEDSDNSELSNIRRSLRHVPNNKLI